MQDKLRVLILGDVVGQSGCRAIFLNVKNLKKTTNSDLVIVNGENATEGRGISPEDANTLFSCGVDIITTGNHIGQRKEIFPVLEKDNRLLRPENYPSVVPGTGHCIVNCKDINVGILNLQGTVNLDNLYCPFKTGRETVEKLLHKTNIIIIDFHAEWPEEKEALALYLDGKVSVLVGTHTHVQTADERIFPGGTAYITDIGMTGPSDSIIGMQKATALRKSITMMPLKMEVADGQADIMGVVVEINTSNGKALSIQRIFEKSKM